MKNITNIFLVSLLYLAVSGEVSERPVRIENNRVILTPSEKIKITVKGELITVESLE